MKKLLFLFTVIALAFITSCKQAPPPPPLPPPPPPPAPKIALEEFVKNVSELPEVKNLELGKSVNVAISSEKVLSPPAEFAVVEKFQSEWAYAELLPVNKQIPLTIVFGDPGSQLLVTDYNDLKSYKPEGNLTVLNPKPAYIVKVGEKTYWVSSGGTLWKTW